MIIKGTVQSGVGVGRHFVEREWVRHQVLTKLGFTPYPGTLNLNVGGAYQMTLERCLQRGVFLVPPTTGYTAGRCVAVRVNNRVRGCIVRPMLADYPSHTVEILAPCNLRALLSLEDEQSVILNLP